MQSKDEDQAPQIDLARHFDRESYITVSILRENLAKGKCVCISEDKFERSKIGNTLQKFHQKSFSVKLLYSSWGISAFTEGQSTEENYNLEKYNFSLKINFKIPTKS